MSESETLGPTVSHDFVYVFDASTELLLHRIKVGSGAFFMAMQPGGQYAFVADKLSCDVNAINVSTFQVASTIHTPSSHGCPYGIAAGTALNTAYAVTGNDETVDQGIQGDAFERLDFETSHVAVTRLGGIDPVTVTVDPTGLVAYVVPVNAPRIYVLNAADGSVVRVLDLPTVHPGSRSSTSTTS